VKKKLFRFYGIARPVILFLGSIFLFQFLSMGRDQEKSSLKLKSTYENVSYGPHERNVLDFWKAKSDVPAPLAIFIPGGGFRSGGKEDIPTSDLGDLLSSGISVASISYRLLPNDPLPGAFWDGRRAIQFLRSKARDWNLDKSKVGCFGSSSGAVIGMYLAFHDDMAMPDSADPIERESTRLTCIASIGGQTSMDMDWIEKWIPGSASVLEKNPYYNRSALLAMFNAKTTEEYLNIVREISALSLITTDDPPIYMQYRMAPSEAFPDDPRYVPSWIVHHVMFGVKLKEKMDKLGIEADLSYPGVHTTYSSQIQFLKAKLGKD
jgi:hypothetical protein